MTFWIKKAILLLLLFSSLFAANAQQKSNLSVTQTVKEDNEFDCGLTEPDITQVEVSVNNEKGVLRNLTYKDFVVYDEKEMRDIIFFVFDEKIMRYKIGFYQNSNNKRRDVKVKLKLSVEKRKEYGKIFVSGQSISYSTQD